MNIYLDESGDTGWILDQPYKKGGSSRFLVIAACLVIPENDHKTERIVRNLYKHRKWEPTKEKKWAQMSLDARLDFATSAAKLLKTTQGVWLRVIVVDKKNVEAHIRQDPNKLYNYMVKLLLIEEMASHERVTFTPDPRSIKVESGNSLHDYLQTELWFTQKSKTVLETTPRDSRHCLNLQFADMVAGVVQSHFEFQASAPWEALGKHIKLRKLFF